MTPSMRLSQIVQHYRRHPDRDQISRDLDEAFSLGHEFGLLRAADEIDHANRKGPYDAIGGAKRIRALEVHRVQPVPSTDENF